MNHKQIGNPDKLVNLLVKLSNMAEPPVRLSAGSDGINCVLEKAESRNSYILYAVSKNFSLRRMRIFQLF